MIRYLDLTYEDIHTRISSVAEDIKFTYDPTHIVAISNGGLIPSGLMAAALKIYDIDVIGVKSYEGQERGDIELYKDIDRTYSADDKVLIVDDIYDSGATMDYVGQYLVDEKNCHRVKSFTVCTKQTECRLDYTGYDFSDVVEWIKFPWEPNLT